MNIPDGTFWSLFGATVGAIVTWLFKHEAQIMRRPTRSEIDKMNNDALSPLKGDLQELKRMVEKNSEQTHLHRTLVADSLAEIRTNVAVLKERMREDGESTGTFRRLGAS